MTAALVSVTPELILAARQEAGATSRPFLEVLEERLAIAPQAFVAALSHAFGYRALSAVDMHALQPDFEKVSFQEASRRDCVLFRDPESRLLFAFADPFSDALRRWAEESIREPFQWYLTHLSDLRAYLARQEDDMRAMENVVRDHATGTADDSSIEALSLRSISEHSSPVIKLVHSTLYDALKSEASDVHLVTSASNMVIKYRIDGVLTTVGTAAGGEFSEQIISRLKVMAELDIAERRIPQDGRFKVNANGREIDFRVSIMPSIYGEDAVLRILDKGALADQISGLRLDHLGFDAPTIQRLRQLAEVPYGMFLVTGPTGSGKTTTLYAAISEINHGEDKIVTIEDPVEYQLPGVLQIPVNEKKGLSFALGLRSILRHDPDKIMVGEIRDPETAQIAVQAALTGHLVFTTVHANSAFDVIGRFLHMNVDPYSFVAAVNGIVGQRLVRKLCPHCTIDETPSAELLAKSGIAPDDALGFRFRTGLGCGQCRGSGYKGRRALAEVLCLDDQLRELITGKEPARRLKEVARTKGTRFLREAALDLVRNGETSLQEINRVTLVD